MRSTFALVIRSPSNTRMKTRDNATTPTNTANKTHTRRRVSFIALPSEKALDAKPPAAVRGKILECNSVIGKPNDRIAARAVPSKPRIKSVFKRLVGSCRWSQNFRHLFIRHTFLNSIDIGLCYLVVTKYKNEYQQKRYHRHEHRYRDPHSLPR